ncbi:MAP kinase kinase kinase win1 [Bienertia sinuspersici]
MELPVTLKFWLGGNFKRDNMGALIYVGRQCRTFAIDSDDCLGWSFLESGLRNVYSDAEVREMVEVKSLPYNTLKRKLLEKNSPQKDILLPKQSNQKIPPYHLMGPQIFTQASQAPETHNKDKTRIETTCVPPSYDWYDPRPESPLRWADLVNEGYDSSDSDSVYDPLADEGQGSDLSWMIMFLMSLKLMSNDEYITARKRVIGCNKQLSDLAQQLQKEAAELGGAGSVGEGGVRGVVTDRGGSGDRGEGSISDYESSDEDIHTPPTSDEDEPI